MKATAKWPPDGEIERLLEKLFFSTKTQWSSTTLATVELWLATLPPRPVEPPSDIACDALIELCRRQYDDYSFKMIDAELYEAIRESFAAWMRGGK